MEPIKFEDNIREKLQERELTPSTATWEKLASQLETNPKTSINKSIWFAVAAGFIGIIIITSFIIKNDFSPSQTTPVLVEETPIKDEILSIKNDVNNMISNSDSTIKNAENDKKSKVSVSKGIVDRENKDSSKRYKIDKEFAAIDVNDTSEEKTILEGNNDEDFVKFKVEEVVAQVQVLQEKNESVSAEEINTLLLNAQREIKSNRFVNNKKVDATALLNVVESELETSFRDKVFEALGDGFEKVRTAVVERDN